MTEFGRTPLLPASELGAARLQDRHLAGVGASRVRARDGRPSTAISARTGSQAPWIDRMQTRRELYRADRLPRLRGARRVHRAERPARRASRRPRPRAWRSIGSGFTRRPLRLPREAQLTWKLAAFAVSAAAAGVDADVADMVACRIVDNAAVALAAIDRPAVAAARAMALAHPRASAGRRSSASRPRPPSTRSGRRGRTARRPASSTSTTRSSRRTTRTPRTPSRHWWPSRSRRTWTARRLLAAIATAYEVHVGLVKGISLHAQKKDHVAHLAPRDRGRARRAARARDGRRATTRSTRRCT